MFKTLQQLMLGSLHRQLIVGMTLTVTLMMGLFVWNIIHHAQTVKIEQYKVQAVALADSLSTSSAIWVASRDFSGLQDIVDGVSRYPDLKHAIVLDPRGQVMAHTEKDKVGLYITELPKENEHQTVHLTTNIIDVTKAIILADRKIGWVRIGLDRKPFVDQIAKIKTNGFYYALITILLGTLITTLASHYLTRRLFTIQKVANKVQAGANHLRVNMQGTDEAALLARQFDRMLDSLTQREMQLASFYSLDLVGLAITSPERGWISVNNCLCNMLEYSEQELQKMTWAELTHPDDLETDIQQFNNIFSNKVEGYSLEKRFISKTGKVITTMLVVRCVRKIDGSVDYVMAMVADISQQKADAIKIEQLAFYDPLTQLPNRRLLSDRLKQALTFSARRHLYGAVLFLDLDDFKTLNDTQGHDIGDILLKEVAKRLTACVRDTDTVSRFGGDEFVILLEGLNCNRMTAEEETKVVAGKILDKINEPYKMANYTHVGTISIGATLFFGHELTIEELLKQADIAMYETKNDGRNALCFFEPQMQTTINHRVELERDLIYALEHRQFQLYYQIQMDSSNKPSGTEALIRWIHPKQGLISPFHFISIAEDSGIIVEIGIWVLETACAQLKAWQSNADTAGLSIAINVSAKQFHQINFVDTIKNAIDIYDINSSLLKIELTESLLLINIEEIIAKMNDLAAIGIQFSLDDFGTGYSSLQYLKRLPLYQLKIDQSFVRDLGINISDEIIVTTIISMAHSLGLNVIAEGVETEEQQRFLLSQGCKNFQGYFFGKPIPINEFEKLLSESKPK
ncbi:MULTISPECIES: EAL domain-containing protein [unclassified Colwellia]|jgi:diguanylate cyclase (GGDEF)-like protein/PAS domain S-box-containing protein|uniref:EAL domain-containing protein n=1 Tax=unclassified Colwellia TaxID=196834 RepID=UPI0015F404C6|nr:MULTISPECIES: EAL domain-containing protein [unclassified Colwellia]MBA6251098.1 EAL domain-containing protein [Colwellia sp. MB3u-55]MBA6398164.1 EAL domain-containing protein [Colwellia sp. BRX10-4]